MNGPRYVYAICRPFDAPLQAQLSGVAGVPPGLLTHDGLVAVVSAVPEAEFGQEPLRERMRDPEWLTATVRAQHGVVDALTAVTTPLPLPPVTVLRDDSEVRAMIEKCGDDFRSALGRLDGRVEWSVTVRAPEAGETAEAGQTAEEFAGRLHRRLSARAEDSRGTVFHTAYLVRRADSEEFVELVERARKEVPEAHGPRIELAGPWACSSFTVPQI